jgi:signal transduction histidine kinase
MDVEEAFERTTRYLAVAKGEIGRLDYIITDFLQALRPTPPKFEAGDLNNVVRTTIELLRPELDNRRVVVREELMRGLPEARFDPVQIKQVLVNLMKNAMHALNPEGILTLATGMGPDAVWISVADNGAGIPPETLSRIFEPFYTTKRKGSGLGLMIVQRILRDHGGRMELTSHVGKGTTFRFWIPRVDPRPRLLEG